MVIAALAAPVAVTAQTAAAKQTAAANASLGTVTLNRRVMANGEPLAPGTYQVRLTTDSPKPGVGQSPDSERYVEFLRGGKVVAREVASIVSAADVKDVADSTPPRPGSSKVELLKGEDYVRVWINRGGTNYILHLPTAKG
jgi:hypothetical protein